MRKNWILMLFFAIFVAAISPVQAMAGLQNQTRCFEFTIDTPDRNEVNPGEMTTMGCYIVINDTQEMAFVKDQDGADLLTTALTVKVANKVTLKHFSMSIGEVKMVEQEEYEINPLPVPATLEEALNSENNIGEITQFTFDQNLETQLRGFLQIYKNPEHEIIKVTPSQKMDGRRNYEEEAYLPDEKMPTDGYWWPHIGLPLAKDEYAPLAKYDAYVQSVAGFNPNTVGWEKANHSSSVAWAGHCNGWVSSSILYGYDDVNLRDELNNTIITSSDLQGLRSVLSYCTRNAFYGRRYYNSNRSDINDIYPTEFHRILKYYIRDIGKPVAYDFQTLGPVDNHIISGYKFTFNETDEEGKWLVQADLRSHSYTYDDYVRERRVAPIYTRTYWYYLWENQYGRFYKGEWVNPESHPDFMWVPLSESRCGRENPRLRATWINHMLENLENIPNKEAAIPLK